MVIKTAGGANKRTFGTPILDYPRDKPSVSLASEKYNVDGRRALKANGLINSYPN